MTLLASEITVGNYRPHQRERSTDAPNLSKAIPNTARDAADRRGGDPDKECQRYGYMSAEIQTRGGV